MLTEEGLSERVLCDYNQVIITVSGNVNHLEFYLYEGESISRFQKQTPVLAMAGVQKPSEFLAKMPCVYVLAFSLLLYLSTVRILRYQRCHQIQSKFTNRPLSSMTAREAYEIMQQLQELEFPYNFHNSLSFGLLKVQVTSPKLELLVTA